MNRSRSSSPESVGDVLQRFLNRSGIGERVQQSTVIPQWPELVGEGIARVARPLKVSDGVLYVEVESSPWMMELNMMRATLLRKINGERRKKGRIERIVFFLANGPPPEAVR